MFNVLLAKHVFSVRNRYEFVEELFRDYLTGETGTVIKTNDGELRREAEDGGQWNDGYLESLAVYRKITESLLDDGIILFHCSALALDGKAYLFTAPSGTGKSTHARLWRERFGERVETINDDKPLIAVSDGKITVYGTPYGGKSNLQTNTSAEVCGIVILYQTPENSIKRVSPHEAYPMLLNQTYRRSDAEGMIKTLGLVKKLSELPVFSMGCNISIEAAEMSHRALTGGQTERK